MRKSRHCLFAEVRCSLIAMTATTETGKALSEKVRWLLRSHTAADLARACGIKAPSIYTWRDNGTVDKRHLPKLAALTGTRPEWWLEPTAPVPPTDEWLASLPRHDGTLAPAAYTYPTGPHDTDAEAPSPDQLAIPMLDVRASAGPGAPQPEHDPIVGRMLVQMSWVRRNLPHVTSPGNLTTVIAYGPSMEPTFHDRSILIVDTGVREVQVDAIYVLQREGQLYVKRVQRRLSDGALLIISDNSHYQPDTLTPDGKYSMEVLGRVVWAFDSKGV